MISIRVRSCTVMSTPPGRNVREPRSQPDGTIAEGYRHHINLSEKTNPSDAPVMFAAMTSSDALPMTTVGATMLTDIFAQQLSQVDGVAAFDQQRAKTQPVLGQANPLESSPARGLGLGLRSGNRGRHAQCHRAHFERWRASKVLTRITTNCSNAAELSARHRCLAQQLARPARRRQHCGGWRRKISMVRYLQWTTVQPSSSFSDDWRLTSSIPSGINALRPAD